MISKFILLFVGLFLMSILGNARSDNFEGRKLKSTVCGKCHGDNGNSTNPTWPNLAGQNLAYLIQEIKAFRGGTRQHPVMTAFAGEVNDANIEALAAYFSSLKPINTDFGRIHKDSPLTEEFAASTPDALRQNTFAQLIKHGESIYISCSGCHGIDGEGIAPYPRLAGQQPVYLKRQLVNFKTGVREGKIMKIIAINLSEEDINALALYLSTLYN